MSFTRLEELCMPLVILCAMPPHLHWCYRNAQSAGTAQVGVLTSQNPRKVIGVLISETFWGAGIGQIFVQCSVRKI